MRDQAVQELLAISPSAIHIRFVWRHLVRWRQDLLDPYIDSENRSAFFGVFYKKPADRGSLQVKADPVVGTLSIPSAAGRAALGLHRLQEGLDAGRVHGPIRGPERARAA